ncbi:hypothetical protein A9R05_21235 [Burkholderia sp. KK1]|nr:hypothetical protein A9R05_21235 [Burkholderia sp. KK1]
MYATFSPPSLEWHKDKAKELRRIIGADRITHWGCIGLLARMYGYSGWSGLCELKLECPMFPTEWDADISAYDLTERWDRFMDELNAALDIDDTASDAILQAANVSRPGPSEAIVSGDDVEDFAEKLQTFLRDMAPHIQAAKNAVTYVGRGRTLRTSR